MTAISDARERFPLDRLRVACSAGEPLNPEVIRWFREQYAITVLDYYGLTESYPLCGNYPTVEVREGSMGLPVPGWNVAILDEDEHPVPAGERGEICLRARSNPHYPLGYWNRPEDTEEDFGGDWFHTKDAAQADEDGSFWYAGRADDVIISAGYRIGPFEVESACVEHPAVQEAAAVAAPDERRGSIVKAFVVLAEGYEASDDTAEEIKRFVRDATRVRVPARDRVHRRPAEDADRQDSASRAARGRARGGARRGCRAVRAAGRSPIGEPRCRAG
jgi:acetyl-CoA synthetase